MSKWTTGKMPVEGQRSIDATTLSADPEAVAVAAKVVVEAGYFHAERPPADVRVLLEALARPGVVKVLDQVASRAAKRF